MKKTLIYSLSILFSINSTLSALNLDEQEESKRIVFSTLPKIPGWCSTKKAFSMMDLIFETKPDVCVEIGVFGGASIFPTASALKYLDEGIVYAIDPWDTFECVKFFPQDSEHRKWWQNIDMNSMYNSFIYLLLSQNLDSRCIVIRETSEKAASRIGSIDILHIDGNHCDASALIDVTLYEPKVKLGGYIWFDGWSSAPEAFEYLKKNCHIKKVVDGGTCILLQKVSVHE